MIEIIGGKIPFLEKVLESDRKYFEENPEAEYGMRLAHPDSRGRMRVNLRSG